MKSLKILLLGIFLIAASNTGKAQGFGVRAGANFTDINVDGLNTDAKTGLYVGVFKEIPLVKSLLFVQPEIQYSQEGFDHDVKNVKIDYLTFPILAKVYALKLLSFETGPQFGIPISDNAEGYYNYNTESFVTSWAFGMSINLPLHLSINARYITGISDTFDSFDSKGQVVQAGAAFRF
ncbi:porin family protein [Flavobacterium gilvum]|uniref:Outer membrane protein beta-barrel domain-containing protein n=1 Tax=Flavobacterium gilvum TaxID=1492737 RepID=A0AAC9I2Y2_9FLAO|nr:porin family protein [Flavobacterium gilvum]AOW08452.1 hypothetical protein EM308_02450 [Flavobacterium gilvum]KFC58522.1 hypothetical protein FEM08_27350 [Flavobacterium gilvum]